MFTQNVFDGEVPILTFTNKKGIKIGELWGNKRKLNFKGNCEESAKIFFDEIIKHNQDYTKQLTEQIKKELNK